MSRAGTTLPAGATTTASAPRRRRRPVVIVVVLVLVGALIAAAVVAEAVIRDRATEQVAEEVRTALSLPAEHPVDVEIAGASVLVQVIGGRLDEVVVRTQKVQIEPFSGDLELTLTGVPLDSAQPVEGLAARVIIAEEAVSAAGAQLIDLPFQELELQEGAIRVTTSVPLFGTEVPLTIALAPSVDAGYLRLTPAGISLADGVDVPLGDVLGLLGLDAEGEALAATSFCVDELLPSGMTLRTVLITDDAIELTLRGEDVSLGGVDGPRSGSCG